MRIPPLVTAFCEQMTHKGSQCTRLPNNQYGMASHLSSISQALAGTSASLPIPKPSTAGDFFGKHTFAAVVARGGSRLSGLPTPPTSVSPNLPAHGFKAKVAKDLAGSPPSQIDSDIDLLDALDHANSQDQPQHGFSHAGGDISSMEGVGHITPVYLAKHHLPGIVLDKGPIAIRHLMNHLVQSVPGFADIPPAKARRIVVGALESRCGGGLKGDVKFEKVGWGRWHARVKGQFPKERRAIYSIEEGNLSPPLSAASSWSPSAPLRIPGSNRQRRKPRRLSRGSCTGESTISSHSEHGDHMDTDVAEHDADRMSIDCEEDQHTCYHKARVHNRPSQPDFYSDTDEEDWASLEPAALGLSSYNPGGFPRKHTSMSLRIRGRRSFPTLPPSVPPLNHVHSHHHHKPDAIPSFNPDSQEREAIEALMRMGSV